MATLECMLRASKNHQLNDKEGPQGPSRRWEHLSHNPQNERDGALTDPQKKHGRRKPKSCIDQMEIAHAWKLCISDIRIDCFNLRKRKTKGHHVKCNLLKYRPFREKRSGTQEPTRGYML